MKISIITICLNEENKIEKTIQSVISQDYANIEYIIIDGGSTDKTISIINNYKNFISIFTSEPDNGIFDAQNKGIKKANGDYILILNAGDYLFKKNAISKIVASITGEDIIYGDIIFELKSGSKYRKYSPKRITSCNMYVESIPHPCTFYKAEIFNKTGYYDLKYKLSADYDFILKCIFKLDLNYKYIRFPVSVFNLGGISSDKKLKKMFLDERNEIQKKYFSNLKFYLLKIFSPIIIFFRKKIYYLYFYLRSKINKRFLGAD